MKYAVEVARLGSLNKAAETLIIAQPNISRSIKELEVDLGITIFTRSAKGMVLTPEGEEFIIRAKSILKQIEDVETLYKQGAKRKQKFSVYVPRSCYISEAFVEFSKCLSDDPAEIIYKETDNATVINKVTCNESKLGIIRYEDQREDFYKVTLEEKGIVGEVVAEFTPVVVVSKGSPLASRTEVTSSELCSYVEILYTENFVRHAHHFKITGDEGAKKSDRKVFLHERASQFELLSGNPLTYIKTSPPPERILDNYGLVQIRCAEEQRVHRDVLIYKDGYKLSALDKRFIYELHESRKRHLK